MQADTNTFPDTQPNGHPRMMTPGKLLISALATEVYLQTSFLPFSLARRQVAATA